MTAALAGLAAAVIGGITLFPRFGYIGVAAAIALSGWVGATALGVVLFRRKWLHLDRRAAGNLPRIAFATALMGVTIAGAVAAMTSLFPTLPASALGRLVELFVLVALGFIVYAAAIDRLGVAKFGEIHAAIRSSR
jgi:putative peptidoglycan lipid II flippase